MFILGLLIGWVLGVASFFGVMYYAGKRVKAREAANMNRHEKRRLHKKGKIAM
jgi:hypothetical protein